MTPATLAPGTCHICLGTVRGNRVRDHLARCMEDSHDLRPVPNCVGDSHRTSQRAVHLSVRAPERPHWIELGVLSGATLHELDRFLRSVWLECCGHLSDFKIDDEVYSIAVPMPGEGWQFDPMDEYETRWRHMGITVEDATEPGSRFEHEHDYGSPTELVIERVAVFEGLVQKISHSQPWHGGRIVVLGRNHSLRSCRICDRPAGWRIVQDNDGYDDEDDEFFEWDEEPDGDYPEQVTYCGECAPEDDDLIILPNSPREGVNCYDNVHSWRTWPLGDYE